MLWAFAVGFGVFFYLAGVWRLRRRGDRFFSIAHGESRPERNSSMGLAMLRDW